MFFTHFHFSANAWLLWGAKRSLEILSTFTQFSYEILFVFYKIQFRTRNSVRTIRNAFCAVRKAIPYTKFSSHYTKKISLPRNAFCAIRKAIPYTKFCVHHTTCNSVHGMDFQANTWRTVPPSVTKCGGNCIL